jgi:hypothetical protein
MELSVQLHIVVVLLLWRELTIPIEGGWLVRTAGIELCFLRHTVCSLVTMLGMLTQLLEVYNELSVFWS